MKSINDDFVWGSDLNKSPFEECAPPLFSIILNMNENGAYYSIDLDKFEVCCMHSCINADLLCIYINYFQLEKNIYFYFTHRKYKFKYLLLQT